MRVSRTHGRCHRVRPWVSPLSQQLQPNHLFKREGLLDVDEAGKIRRWDAYYYGAGGSGFVVLRNPDDVALRQRVATLLRTLAADPANGILTVFNQDDLRARGADPRASFAIDMQTGFYSGSGHDVLLTKATSKGGYGRADPAGTPRVTRDPWARCGKDRQPWRSA